MMAKPKPKPKPNPKPNALFFSDALDKKSHAEQIKDQACFLLFSQIRPLRSSVTLNENWIWTKFWEKKEPKFAAMGNKIKNSKIEKKSNQWIWVKKFEWKKLETTEKVKK